MKLQAHKFEHRGKFPTTPSSTAATTRRARFEQHLRNQKIPYCSPAGSRSSTRPRSRTSPPTCACWPTTTTIRPSSAPSPRPSAASGGSTLEALGTYAGERHISLFAAAFEEGFAHRVQPRQLAPLLEFCEFINRMEYRAAKEPAQQVMPDLLAAIGYEAGCTITMRARRDRWANVWSSRQLADAGRARRTART
jgi:ATP-dependent DNA helicase Rep